MQPVTQCSRIPTPRQRSTAPETGQIGEVVCALGGGENPEGGK